MRGPKLIQL